MTALDHDRLFKELITTFFVEFVELFLPEVRAYLDRNSVEFLDKEVFTDVTEGERHEADIVVKARFREEDAFFLIHVENQASAQPEFGRRMFRYFARLYEKHGLPVYPVVVFSYREPKRPEPDEFRVTFPDLDVLEFRFRVIQLNRLNWRDFVDRPNPIASALMSVMAIAEEDRPRVKLECLRLLATLRLDPARMKLICGFVDSYLRLTREENRRLLESMPAVMPEQEETVMNIVTSWMEEGIEQGIEQGIQRGLQEGEARLMVRQLTRKLGDLPLSLRERISTLPVQQLEALSDEVFVLEGVAHLERWLDGQPEQAEIDSATE
jgi:predicted transposase YdaD